MNYRSSRRRLRLSALSIITAITVLTLLIHRQRAIAASLSATSPTQPATLPSPDTKPTSEPTTQSAVSASAAIAAGEARFQAGELLAARQMLNDALLSGNLTDPQATSVRQLISTINQTVIFSPQHFPDDPYGGSVTVEPGQHLARIAMNFSDTWELLAQINDLSNPKRLRAGQTLKIIKGPFNAVVNKSAFTMDIWLGPPEKQGGMYITTYRVGLGQDDSTPTGAWLVAPSAKLRNPTYFSPRGQGIIQADDPKNPLGKYWIGLTGTEGQALGKMSYGIHGTIDPTSIGHMSSLGCIRLGDADIAQVFQLLVEGKSVVIVRK